MIRSSIKYNRDKYRHIEGEIDYQYDNAFEALREAEEIDKGESNESTREGESTKDWVNKTFALKEQKDKLMEPFEDNQGLEEFRRRLGMEQAVASTNGKSGP
ncbi:hypothetical protein RDI58_017505 [Solanum bulbocastanum]|uniref:Uncharacterized protein n=1 Tax=Solanum bulbocastanum TaxID=147425 RepID=A0AAN8TES6_SOLBU